MAEKKYCRIRAPLVIALTAALLPCAASGLDLAPEGVHTASLIAQSQGMERRFWHQNLFLQDKYLEEYLNGFLEKLTMPDERQFFNPRVRVLRGGAVDAFAAPDGVIYISAGLLARVTEEAQIAAVLGHELAHIVGRHTEKNLLILKELSRAEALASLQASAPGPVRKPARAAGPARRGNRRETSGPASLLPGGGVRADMAEDALRVAVGGYRQELENEADSIALARMAAAGYPLPEDFRQFVGGIADIGGAVGRGEGGDMDYLSIKLGSAVLADLVASYSAGKFDVVDAQSERLLAVDGCDPSALLIRGDMERLMSPRSTAWVEWYERALSCDPGDLAALRAMGFAYHSIGNKDRACEYLGRYKELAGDAPDIRMAMEALMLCEE